LIKEYKLTEEKMIKNDYEIMIKEKRVCGDSVEDTRYQRVFMDENLLMLDAKVGQHH
jgi:hypothetical protein